MTFPNGQIITVLRDVAGGVDAWGDPVPASTSRTDIADCGIAPMDSNEPQVLGRNGVVIDLRIFAPYGSDILFTDRIEINGGGTVAGAPVTPATAVVYTIDGTPAKWSSPQTGTEFMMVISCQRGVG